MEPPPGRGPGPLACTSRFYGRYLSVLHFWNAALGEEKEKSSAGCDLSVYVLMSDLINLYINDAILILGFIKIQLL